MTAPDDPPRYQVRVAELPADERPRERLLRLGPHALTSAELLAILLRTGTSRDGTRSDGFDSSAAAELASGVANNARVTSFNACDGTMALLE